MGRSDADGCRFTFANQNFHALLRYRTRMLSQKFMQVTTPGMLLNFRDTRRVHLTKINIDQNLPILPITTRLRVTAMARTFLTTMSFTSIHLNMIFMITHQ